MRLTRPLPLQQCRVYGIWHALEWQIWIVVDHCYCELETVLYHRHCLSHAGRTAHPDAIPMKKNRHVLFTNSNNFKSWSNWTIIFIHLLYSSVTEIFSPLELIGEVSVLPVEIPCHKASVPPVHKSHQTMSTAPKLLPTFSEQLRGHQISSPIPVWELWVPVWSPHGHLLLCLDTVSLQILQLNLTFQTQHLSLLPIPINDKGNYLNSLIK